MLCLCYRWRQYWGCLSSIVTYPRPLLYSFSSSSLIVTYPRLFYCHHYLQSSYSVSLSTLPSSGSWIWSPTNCIRNPSTLLYPVSLLIKYWGSTQRANGQYQDHLVGQLTAYMNPCFDDSLLLIAYMNHLYSHHSDDHLHYDHQICCQTDQDGELMDFQRQCSAISIWIISSHQDYTQMITKSVARLIEMGIDGFSTTVFCWLHLNHQYSHQDYDHLHYDHPFCCQTVLVMILSITRLIEMGIDGFSTTVFCYGQTGSGKTHTLTGPPYLVSFFLCFIWIKSNYYHGDVLWHPFCFTMTISLMITVCAMVDTVYMNNEHAVDRWLFR